MKILLVSSSILPRSGGSSVIVENLAKNFRADEMIVLGSKGITNNTEYKRSKDNATFRYFFSELSVFGRGARFFDWFRKLRFNALVNEISNLIIKEEIDHVIGVYPNLFYCLAACRAAKNSNIPFSAYFHNTYVENSAIKEPEAMDNQQEIFDNSIHIFVMSDGMRTFYEKKYGVKKFLPLVHTFNEFPDRSKLTGPPGEGKKTYKLVAIGNFNQSNLEATIRFVNAIKNNPKYTLSIYTHVPKVLLMNRGLDPGDFEHLGAVDPEEVHDEIQKYDICVLTHGFHGGYGEIEYQTIFPTRTIPFLLSGKPIMAHSPKGSFLNSFIQKHDCAALVDEASQTDIITSLDKIADNLDYQNELISNAHKASSSFYGPTVAQRLKETLLNKPVTDYSKYS